MDPRSQTNSTADASQYPQSYLGSSGNVPRSPVSPADFENLNNNFRSLNVNGTDPSHHDPQMRNGSVSYQDDTHGSTVHPASGMERSAIGSQPNVISGRNAGRALNSQYRIQRHPERYFDVGTVFAILWNEPAGNNGTLISTPRITEGLHGQRIYNSIRRMVVVKKGSQCAWCLPILTYGGKGLAKSGIIPEDHAVIYMRGSEPTTRSNESKTTKEPLEVKPATHDQKLDKMSRLNFGKVYTVEYNIPVMPVGVLSSRSKPKLINYARQSFELEERDENMARAPPRSDAFNFAFPGSY
ncbi:hypothetical protein PHISCL_02724 [Aspergillus sclerotialis]|uniref:DUF6590 domain-containing protein n=1 Tax=Aspergillus sclerotialis TaxID=2070753 RepID=A0A3A2ZQG8_9EURO|nr:hypothetical protein PHISCL_02724 [Aspergillus sclerotialis]